MRSHAHKKNAEKKSPRGSASARASKTASPVAGKTGNRLLGRVAQQLAAEATEKKHGHRGEAAGASSTTADRLLPRAAQKKHLRHAATARASFKPSGNGEMFRSLLDSLNIGVAHVTADGTILYANERFGELLGLESRKDLTGTLLRDYVSKGNWPSLITALERASRGPVEGESRVSRLGSKHILRLSFAPLAGANLRTIRVAATEVTQLMETTKALQQSEASLHELSRELVRIQDQERRSMARNLHDVTGQELAVAVVSLDRLARNLDAPKADVQANLEECAGWIRKVEGEVRTLSYMLHPPLLDEMGLGMALDVYTKGFTKRTGIEINLQVSANLPRLPQEKEVGMFRVIQECLSNVLRHSGSQRAWVRVGLQNGTFRVSVRDEGKGIGAKRNGTSLPQGVGMQSMSGRLRIMGGALEVKSDRHGTEVIATAPVERDEILATDNAANAELSMADLDAAQTQMEAASAC